MPNFVFLESWMDMIDAIKENQGEDVAGQYALQILECGTRGRITTTDPMIAVFVNSMIKPLIDKSQKRYAACKSNGEQGGKPAQYDHEKMIELYEQGMNKNQIAKELKCSYNTVRSVIDKYETEKNDEAW